MTRAAISSSITRLELHLGQRLFERRTGRRNLTPAGERLLAKVAPLMNELRTIDALFREDDSTECVPIPISNAAIAPPRQRPSTIDAATPNSITRKHLVRIVGRQAAVSTQTADGIVTQLLGEIAAALSRGENVKIARFGTFRVSQRTRPPPADPNAGVSRLTVEFVPSRRMSIPH